MSLEGLRQERARKAAEQWRNDLIVLLRLPEFRRFLERMVWETQLLGSSRGATGEDMAYLAGRRDVGRALLGVAGEVDPLSVGKMLSDHFLRLSAEREEDSKAAASEETVR